MYMHAPHMSWNTGANVHQLPPDPPHPPTHPELERSDALGAAIPQLVDQLTIPLGHQPLQPQGVIPAGIYFIQMGKVGCFDFGNKQVLTFKWLLV